MNNINDIVLNDIIEFDLSFNDMIEFDLSFNDILKFDIYIIEDNTTDDIDYIVVSPEIIWLINENDVQDVNVLSNIEWIVK